MIAFTQYLLQVLKFAFGGLEKLPSCSTVRAGLEVSLLADLESSGMLLTVYELHMSSAASV